MPDVFTFPYLSPEISRALLAHTVAALIALWPLHRVYRRAGLEPWPAFLVLIPVFGVPAAFTRLAFKRWPILPAPPPKRQRRPKRDRNS
jgi:hypothetical protein